MRQQSTECGVPYRRSVLLHYLMRCRSLAVDEDRDVGELSLLEHTMN